jgi:hypothetical protein
VRASVLRPGRALPDAAERVCTAAARFFLFRIRRKEREGGGTINSTLKRSPTRSFPLLLGVVAWLYLTTFALPHTPIYQGDSSPIFLHEAVRMLHGEVIYRDFFELRLPGTQFLYMGLFKLLGVRTWIANVTIRDYLQTHYHLVRNFGSPAYEQV